MNEELTLARILEVDRWSREQAEALRPQIQL